MIRPLAIAGLSVAVGVASGCGTRAKGQAGLDDTRTSASYIAALGNGIVGQNTGVKLTGADRQRALEAEYRALEAAPGGQPVVWAGSGIRGSVVASAPYQVGSQNCRQYSHTVVSASGAGLAEAGAGEHVARGVACRNGNGTWTPLT